jgi:tetratricopeptide (TPR) repeat protein
VKFGKWFGGRSLEEERGHADALFAQGEFGSAKLAYDRALGLAKGMPELQASLQTHIDACRDAIAKQHLAEAERLVNEGNVDFARDELHQVKDTAVDKALLRLADDLLDRLERAVVRAELQEHEAPAEEDRFELIAGGFEEDQYAEYMAHGEPAKRALLLLHDGRTADARAALEALIEGADGPRYLWFELGRARLADGETEGGQEALERFLHALHAEEGGDARLLAETELAQLAHARGDFDAAVAHYESALTSMPDDPRPYLAMAAFFRREKLTEEAIEVLESGIEALDGQQPDFRLWQELGLALADAGRDAEAIEHLERVVALLSSQHHHTELPPEGAIRLADLYERSGRPARALDLYSLLARGSDRPNLHLYHEQAARLMEQLGLHDDARRMLLRARELAPAEDAEQQRIAQKLAALEQPGSAP